MATSTMTEPRFIGREHVTTDELGSGSAEDEHGADDEGRRS